MKDQETQLNNSIVIWHSSYIANVIFIKGYRGYAVFGLVIIQQGLAKIEEKNYYIG